MPVLSHSEYLQHKEKEKSKEELNKEVSPSISRKAKKEIEKNPYWHLLHPENGSDDLQNFEDTIKINDVEYIRKCVNGIIITQEKELAEFLITKGYEVLYKGKEVKRKRSWMQ